MDAATAEGPALVGGQTRGSPASCLSQPPPELRERPLEPLQRCLARQKLPHVEFLSSLPGVAGDEQDPKVRALRRDRGLDELVGAGARGDGRKDIKMVGGKDHEASHTRRSHRRRKPA